MRSKILDYVDFEKANALLEGFNKSTGFVTAILDLEGNVLSQSGWRSICVNFHRKHPISSKNCFESDLALSNAKNSEDKYHFYKCLNGLIDVRIPIVIRGEHVANLFTGQFFFEKPNVAFFKKQVVTYSYDEKAYLDALAEVPVLSKEKVEVAMDFLLNITKLIIEMTAEKMEQIELNEVIRRSEAALLNSQIQLKQNVDDLLESQKIAHLGTWRLDLSTNEVVWTEELYNMYGFDPTIPPPAYTEHMKLFTPESWNRLSSSLEHTRTSGVPYELELETITKYGTNGWMWVRGEAHKDEHGVITSLWGAAQDITERKRAEQRIKHQNELFTSLLKLLPVGVFMVDAIEGTPLVVNEMGISLLGSGLLPETYEHNLSEVYKAYQGDTKKHYPTEQMPIILGMKGISSHIEDMVVERPDESRILLEVFGTPVKDEQGKTWASLVTFSDITERKKAEERLFFLSYHDHLTNLYNRRFFEEELKRLDIEENLPISIIMCDVNGLKLVNDSFGHSAGDELLIKAAETIKEACREKDIVARIGGDEFGAILTKTSIEETLNVSDRIKELASMVKVANLELSISYGYDTKTSSEQLITEVIGNAENYMYRHKLYERSSLRSKNIDLVMSALFEKSSRETIHSNRVGKICKAIGIKMHFDKASVNKLGIAGLIHDIGKIGIDEVILNKPGSLDDDERRAVERHPEVGWRLLSSTDEFSEVAQFVLSHHEKWDGSGYPNGLKGEMIPIESRIIAIADAFDAMTRARSYRKEMNIEDVIKELKRCAGTQFDPTIVDIFLNQVLSENNDF